MTCSALKVQDKEGDKGSFWLYYLSSQEATTCDEVLLPMNWLDISVPTEHKEWIIHFALLETLIYLSSLYLDLQVFLTFLSFFIVFCSH